MNIGIKTVVMVSLAAFLGWTAATAAKAGTLQEDVFNPSVQIGGFCSGEIVYSDREKKSGEASTYVLTAKHCVSDLKDDSNIVINRFEYSENLRLLKTIGYSGKVYGRSFKSDLALIKLKDKDTVFDDVAKVADLKTPIVYGEEVHVIGYPMGQSMTYTKGNLGFVETVEAFSQNSQSREFYRATPDVVGGSSGSSMFIKTGDEYRIIGTLTGQYTIGTFMNYFTPLEKIHEYLDIALPKPESTTGSEPVKN